MKKLVSGCLLVLAALVEVPALAGEWVCESGRMVYRTYQDSDGNCLTREQYNAKKADYNLKASLPGSTIDRNGVVTYWPDELARARSGTYRTESTYGTSYRTTNNYGTTYSTENNFGRVYKTINNYDDSFITVNNYGTGRTTVNDYGSSLTTVNRLRFGR